MSVEIYDIETLSNCFTYTGLDRDTKDVFQFVIHKDRNDLNSFIDHLNELSGQIGFNNLNFDGQVIQFILNNYNDWLILDGEKVSEIIYSYSQKVIEISNSGGFPQFPEWKMKIHQLDLFKIWHFDNKAKMTSLKWIEYMIDLHDIQEMPIHHSSKVTLEQIDSILSYNLHDVNATYELYKITIGDTDLPLYKGVDKIQLRKDIISEFGIKCINFNDVKIGDALNKLNYCRISDSNPKSLPKSSKRFDTFTFKDCFPSYYKFTTPEFQGFVKAISGIEVDLKKKQEYEFTFNGTTYSIAKGGLHSRDKSRLVKPSENEILRDCDVGSMYPNAIVKRELYPRHLGKEWLIGYKDIIEKRIAAKRDGKKAINEAYKLALNGGGFGKTNEEFSWQFDPFVTYCVTIGSQIDLLMLIEMFEVNKIHVISANTDGLVCLFDKNLNDIYYKVCKDWEILVGNDKSGQLEYVDYKFLCQSSVNDYLAIKYSGEVKTKGDFVSDFELHKNKSARIVPIALQKYYVEGISVEETIRNHTNIYDFCLGVKSIGKNRLISIDVKNQVEKDLQKINRYYISNQGVNIVKRLPKLDNVKSTQQLDIFGNVNDGTRESEIEAGFKSTIFNTYIEKEMKDYDINYKFYIDKCKRIIQ